MTQELKRVFQVTSEGESLILKTNSTEICFDNKLANSGGKGFLLTTKLCKNPNYAAFLVPEEQKTEGKSYVQTQGVAIKQQDKTTTKNLRCGKFTSTISTLISAIPEKTICV